MCTVGLLCADHEMASTVLSALGAMPGADVHVLPEEQGRAPERFDVLLTDGSTAARALPPPAASLVLLVSVADAGSVRAAAMVLAALTGIVRLDEDDLITALSARERQVLRLIADGLTQDQTARRLGISRHTVDTYVKRVRGKLGLGNKAELVRAAMPLTAVPV